jgi:hypothetical protein
MRLEALTCPAIVLALIACSDSPKTIGPLGLSAAEEELPPKESICPDGFAPTKSLGSDPDRNGDGIVCRKVILHDKTKIQVIVIDNPHSVILGPKGLELQGCLVGFVAVQSAGDEADQNGDGTVCQQDIGIPNVVAVSVFLDN